MPSLKNWGGGLKIFVASQHSLHIQVSPCTCESEHTHSLPLSRTAALSAPPREGMKNGFLRAADWTATGPPGSKDGWEREGGSIRMNQDCLICKLDCSSLCISYNIYMIVHLKIIPRVCV